MHRFIFVTGCVLIPLALPLHAKPKTKPPAISVCSGSVCLTGLKWQATESSGFLPGIEGVFRNGSNATISNLSLEFAMLSGPTPVDTCSASFDPVFNPLDERGRKKWEKIHGKRER